MKIRTSNGDFFGVPKGPHGSPIYGKTIVKHREIHCEAGIGIGKMVPSWQQKGYLSGYVFGDLFIVYSYSLENQL